MGCAQANAVPPAVSKICPPFSKLQSDKTAESKGEGGLSTSFVHLVSVAASPCRPWQSTLGSIRTIMEESEKTREQTGAIWRQPSSPLECQEDSLAWKDAYAELQHRPVEEVLHRLSDIQARPWQGLWRSWAAQLRSLPTQEEQRIEVKEDWKAVEILEKMVSNDLTPNQVLVTSGLSAEGQTILAAGVHALQELLALQEELSWMTRAVAAALAVEPLRPRLAAALQRYREQEAEEATPALAASETSMVQCAIAGFEFQGVLFRMVVDEEDWKTVCAEVRKARASVGWSEAARLLVTVEGMGLRLLASPTLPWHDRGEKESAQTMATALSDCCRWLQEQSHQLRIAAPSGVDLQRWCASLSNPRRLLSLEVPLAAALRVSRGLPAKVSVECLALVFGAPPGDLTGIRCSKPEVRVASSPALLLDEVASALSCCSSDLQRFDAPGLFGCACEVWYLPEAGRGKATGESSGAESPWEWQSNCFGVLFTGLATRPPFLHSAVAKDEAADPVDEGLPDRILAAAQLLAANPGRAQHPRYLRCILRAQRIPARLSCGLAELRLVGHSSLPSGEARLEEAVAVDIMARAAKHAVRHILTRRQLQESSHYFRGKWKRTAPEEPDGFQLQRFWAMDNAASLESLNGEVIAQEAQLLATAPAPTAPAEADLATAIAPEAPIPPIPPLVPQEPAEEKGKEKRTFRLRNPELEDEVQLMICALQLHPEASLAHSPGGLGHQSSTERLATLRLGLLHVVSWVRLAAAAHELHIWHAERGRDSKDPSWTSSLSTTYTQADKQELDGPSLATLLNNLGQRLFNVSRQSVTALVRSVASQLHISLPKEFLFRLRAHNSGLSTLPMRVPSGESTGARLPRCNAKQLTHTRTSLDLKDSLGEVLDPSLQQFGAGGDSASAKLAADLVNKDLSLSGRWHRGLFHRGVYVPISQMPNVTDPTVGSGPWQDMLTRSFATGSVALQRPSGVQDHLLLKQKVIRCKALLRCAQVLLVAEHPRKFQGSGMDTGQDDVDNCAAQREGPETAVNSVEDSQASSYKKVTTVAARALQTVANLLGELGENCPSELFVALFALRGYICEQEGDVDACYLHYLQSLAALDDAWGDPRKPGSHGHPFALFLLWKLGLISYGRKDLLSISKFGDYFRALLLFYGDDSPFSWGPSGLAEEHRQLLDSEKGCLEALHRSEAKLGKRLESWWHRHDILDFGDEGFPPSLQLSFLQVQGKERDAQRDSNSGIAGDRQDVWRGTVFTFGFNELGQLGIGASTSSSQSRGSGDLTWSGSPVRVVSFKDLRIKDVACGEAHCLALDMEGQLYAWGFDEFCQVAGKTAADEVLVQSPLASPRAPRGKDTSEGSCRMVPKPHRLSCSVSFVGIACGAQFSLALDTAGGVWCWGNGEGGVLGLGSASLGCRTLARIPIPSARSASEECCKLVSCGSYHAMAVSKAGVLYSWGRSEGGQLGLAEQQVASHIEEFGLRDTCVCQPTPVAFPDTPEKGKARIEKVAGGDVHSLAVDSEGCIWSWGWGEFGQLGLGFSSSSYELGMGGASSRRPTPQPIAKESFGGRVLSIACGGAFSAALVAGELSEGGHLAMWGANDVGQCGLPAKKPMDIAVPKEVPGLRGILLRSVACGTTHAVAIDLGGQAFSWGSAHYGKLGRLDPPQKWSTPILPEPCEPGIIRSLARLRISKAACGLHHTLLATEVRRRRMESVEEASTGSQASSKMELSTSMV